MIQRIQSVYLFLSAILCGTAFFLPLACFKKAGEEAEAVMRACSLRVGETTVSHPWGVSLLLALVTLFSLVVIFGYKNRKQQVKRVNLTMFLLLFSYITAACYVWAWSGNYPGCAIAFMPGAFLPLISYLCLWLARRAIQKDEALVAASDRIR